MRFRRVGRYDRMETGRQDKIRFLRDIWRFSLHLKRCRQDFEILQKPIAILRADGFGMKLNAKNGFLSVAQPHNESVLRSCHDLQTVR